MRWGRQGSPLRRCPFLYSIIPNNHLSWVRTPQYQIGMKPVNVKLLTERVLLKEIIGGIFKTMLRKMFTYLANVAVRTMDWQWKTYSGVAFLNFEFHTRHTPSGSWADSWEVWYDATSSSGYWGDQSREVTQRVFDQRSSENQRERTSLPLCLSSLKQQTRWVSSFNMKLNLRID